MRACVSVCLSISLFLPLSLSSLPSLSLCCVRVCVCECGEIHVLVGSLTIEVIMHVHAQESHLEIASPCCSDLECPSEMSLSIDYSRRAYQHEAIERYIVVVRCIYLTLSLD